MSSCAKVQCYTLRKWIKQLGVICEKHFFISLEPILLLLSSKIIIEIDIVDWDYIYIELL